MSDRDNTPDFNRRNLLKVIGGAAALTTFSTTAQAVSGPKKTKLVNAALETDSFEKFEAEFGPIDVDPKKGRVTKRGADGDQAMRIELNTNVGKMGIIQLESKEGSIDFTLLDVPKANYENLPDSYDTLEAVPPQTKAILFTTSERDGIHFRRDATNSEKRALAQVTDIPYAELDATLESERGGFVVGSKKEHSDALTQDFVTVTVDEFLYQEISDGKIRQATVNDKPVSAQMSWWCRYKCGSCLAKAAKCVGCCVATSLGCIACILWQCGLGANSCYDCYDCID